MKVKEEFRDVPGWEGMYQVSDHGNVKSLRRKNGPIDIILRPAETMDGYLKVDLRRNGKHHNIEINRLVLLTFVDKDYANKGFVCDHIDRNRKNNRLTNLRVATQRENSVNSATANGLVGASYHKGKGKWQSNIHINGKQVYLGAFETEIEAHEAYKEALANLEKAIEQGWRPE